MEENTQNSILSRTFFWMFLGLLGTGIVAWYTYATELYLKILITDSIPVILVLELVVVLLFTFLFKKLPPTVVGILYFLYAMINGVTLSTIFVIYELNSIVLIFVVSALLFAGLAYWGHSTKKDLSNWGTLLSAALIAGLIISIINLFLGNSVLDIAISWVMLFVFFGFTAYDMQKILTLASDESLNQEKIHIYCAMQLYLDFINILLRLLRLFAKKRN